MRKTRENSAENLSFFYSLMFHPQSLRSPGCCFKTWEKTFGTFVLFTSGICLLSWMGKFGVSLKVLLNFSEIYRKA